jgi:hypothetical protein
MVWSVVHKEEVVLMKRAKWVMCCWQLITMIECPSASGLLVVLMVTFQFSGCGTVRRCKFRVMRSTIIPRSVAASSARIRCASEVVRTLSPGTGRIGGKVAAVMWRT